jgi:hypothetical protein
MGWEQEPDFIGKPEAEAEGITLADLQAAGSHQAALTEAEVNATAADGTQLSDTPPMDIGTPVAGGGFAANVAEKYDG